MRYLGAIDQGTTSTRFIIFDERGEIVSSAQIEHRQIFPQPGWVEHDAEEIWANVMKVVHSALAKASMDASALSGIGITNQRETVVAFNPKTGRVYHNAIVSPVPEWFDIMPQGVSKASGLEPLLEALGITLDEVAVFGDAENDLEILHMVRHSVAVANATDEVLETARYRVGPVSEEGVADALLEIARTGELDIGVRA